MMSSSISQPPKKKKSVVTPVRKTLMMSSSISKPPKKKKSVVTPVCKKIDTTIDITNDSLSSSDSANYDPYHPRYKSQKLLLSQEPHPAMPNTKPAAAKPSTEKSILSSDSSVQVLGVTKPPPPAYSLGEDDSTTIEVLGTTQAPSGITATNKKSNVETTGILTPSPTFKSKRHKKYQEPLSGEESDQKDADDASSCVIDWVSQSREIKQEKLRNKIEERESRRKRANYHKKAKRLQIGDIVTGKVGKIYRKPNGKNNLKKPVLGKIMKSIDDNTYKVKFINNTEHVLKSSQLVKQKNDVMYKKLTEEQDSDDNSSAPTFKNLDNNNNNATNSDSYAVVNLVNVVDSGRDAASSTNNIKPHSQVSSQEQYNKNKDDDSNIHEKRYRDAVAEIKSETGRKIKVKSKKEEMVWTIVGESLVFQKQQQRTNNKLGIKDLSILKEIENSALPLAELFLKLSFRNGEWERALVNMNRKIEEFNTNLERSNKHCDSQSTKGSVKPFTKKEFLCCIALVVGASDCSDKGEALWSNSKSKGKKDEQRHWETICEKTDFRKYIPLYRFKHFRTFFPKLWEEDQHSATDPWWKFSSAVRDFNEIRKELILPSEIIAVDESMSAFRPQTTSTGGFPNISFIARKPENLGTEFKSSVCPVLGVMMFLELQRGKHGMTGHKYFKDIGATASCTVRVAEGSSHKHVDNIQEVVLGDSWFGSVKAAVGLAQEGFECILQVKQNHGLYPKNLITEILKDSPGGTKVVLQGTHPSGVDVVATGYKYNKKSILYFVSTPNGGSTEDGDPYEMKFADENSNIHIREVPRPAFISFFFQHCNAVDIHNHLRQSSLRLEKKWITFDGYFRLCTTMLGINVVDTYRLARFHSLLPRGKYKLNKDYEKDFVEDDDNGFTMKRFAGVLSTQLLFMADSFKVEKYYVDDKGNLKCKLESHGKKNIVDKKDGQGCASVDHFDGNDSSEEAGTRMQPIDPFRFRSSTDSLRKNMKRRAKREKECSKRRKNTDDGEDGILAKTVMFWADEENDNKARGNGSISSVSCNFTEDENNRLIETFQDVYGDPHTVMKLKSTVSCGKKTKGKHYCKPRQCVTCGQKARTFCYECEEVHCYPIRKNILVEDSCFTNHMQRHKVRRGKKSRGTVNNKK